MVADLPPQTVEHRVASACLSAWRSHAGLGRIPIRIAGGREAERQEILMYPIYGTLADYAGDCKQATSSDL